MKLFFRLSILLFFISNLFAKPEFVIDNEAYAYNAENTYWEETRTTLTYFGNIFEPKILLEVAPKVKFTFGLGLFIPFDQEQDSFAYFPIVQTKLNFKYVDVIIGSLENNHNFPATIINELASLVPEIRIINNDRVQITRGRYEYGLQFKWKSPLNTGDFYMNWQLKDTAEHRERFDVGVINSFTPLGIPLYGGVHYWHNGGHEHPHPISITENYVGAFGIRNEKLNILYHASYYLPDREDNESLNFFGQGFYFDTFIRLKKMTFQPVFWITDEYLDKTHKYFSAEGDPFFRVPLYIGLNFIYSFLLEEGYKLDLVLKNGTFQAHADKPYSRKMIRYDQKLSFSFSYKF